MTYRPNVIIILTDQQRFDSVGYVSDFIKTPHLDRLSNQSVICTNAFVQSPQCQPSRASILTGRYPTSHKVLWNNTPLSTKEITIGNLFRDNGYNTAYFGKLHVDTEELLEPTRIADIFGFTHSYLYEDWLTLISGKLHFNKSVRTKTSEEYFSPMRSPNWTGSISAREFHHEDVVTDQCISFLNDIQQPYFVIISYCGPHPPYAAPTEYSALYENIPLTVPSTKVVNHLGHTLSDEEWLNLKRQYYGCISWIDSNIGKLLGVIGADDIVVFMSDHGDILGDHGLFSKGQYAYEGVVKIPLLIKSNQLRPGRYGHIFQSIDLFPTLASLCDIGIPSVVQGTSGVDYLNTRKAFNHYTLSMFGYDPRLRMIRTPTYKYWIVNQEEHLFNLRDDPLELRNLAFDLQYCDILSEFRKRLLMALIKSEDTIRISTDIN